MTLTTVLFYILVAVFAVQIIYHLYFLAFCFSKEKVSNAPANKPISIIVYTKNNDAELKKNLIKILNQNYPNFEVVVVNNASFDDTTFTLEDLQKEYTYLKVVNVENTEAFWGNKKYALTLGVKAATHEHLVFTEVNSRPISDNWLATMASKFSDTKDIVIGYTKFHTSKLSFLGLLVRFEHLLKHVVSLSFAKYGSPYYTSEQNFAYKKSSFFAVKGYINHLKINAKHSDLFVKEAGTKKNTVITTIPNSFVSSELPSSFLSWFKTLELETFNSKYYKFKHRFLLNILFFSKIVFYGVSTTLLFLNWQFSLPFILVYLLFRFIVVGKSSIKLKEKNLIYFLPLLEAFLLLLQISIFIKNRISKPSL
ncbi:glycosyltransferase [uncultured Tenacibaculum sp.]|uniref:glycosyltransferase n=1 Tax=uncultured Tenacibaculum sp. TaxID=174713 RepID=UPI0026096190|nr:glycosyltransferase [uncultured Tenacibaculum sp.]